MGQEGVHGVCVLGIAAVTESADGVGVSQMFSRGQQTTKLMFSQSVRGQKAFALDYCAASFVTEGERSRSSGGDISKFWKEPVDCVVFAAGAASGGVAKNLLPQKGADRPRCSCSFR